MPKDRSFDAGYDAAVADARYFATHPGAELYYRYRRVGEYPPSWLEGGNLVVRVQRWQGSMWRQLVQESSIAPGRGQRNPPIIEPKRREGPSRIGVKPQRDGDA